MNKKNYIPTTNMNHPFPQMGKKGWSMLGFEPGTLMLGFEPGTLRLACQPLTHNADLANWPY